ncbi:MAG TPA: hypothetical protein VE944_19705 [Nostoc sp.]|uniref:hypothetical protein n=1 Tax=Nostoc sp. TaxID=1180 RepID=UPI002D490742|nr:hypothetical protein [Nostoc sp.]HYX16546.1 hypothetical protein [Nostoc sp.]
MFSVRLRSLVVILAYTCEDVAGGGIISRPYFEAAANTFSMSAGLMLGTCVLSETSTPTSQVHFLLHAWQT